MILDLVSIITYSFNFIAFFFVMYGWDSAKGFFAGLTVSKRRLLIAVSLIAAAIASLTRMYILVFFLIEYLILLIWSIKQGNKDYTRALWGILDMICIMIVELLCFMIAYQSVDPSIFTEVLKQSEQRIMLTSGQAMIMFQYLIVIMENIQNMRKKVQRGGVMMLIIKFVENAILIYMSILSIQNNKRYVLMVVLLILTIIFDYPMLMFIIPKLKSQEKLQDHTDSNVNMYEYYLNMEEEHRQIRKLYHEMKNQMMIMQNAQGQTDTKLSDLEKSLESIEKNRNTYHTGQPSLDALLYDSERRAKSENIEFEAIVSEGCLAFMQDDDVNYIFRNGILNAIEACEHIEEGPRWITIKAGKNEASTMIYIKNSASPKRQKGTLKTIKKDKKLHGIGLTTIRECVEKYNGYLSIIEKDNTFQMAILFGRGEEL